MPVDLSQTPVFLNAGRDTLQEQVQILKNHKSTLHHLDCANVGWRDEDDDHLPQQGKRGITSSEPEHELDDLDDQMYTDMEHNRSVSMSHVFMRCAIIIWMIKGQTDGAFTMTFVVV